MSNALRPFWQKRLPPSLRRWCAAWKRGIDRLTRLPFLGRPMSHGGLRETIVPYGKSRYVIRYKVTETTIQIVRIWHGRENRPA